MADDDFASLPSTSSTLLAFQQSAFSVTETLLAKKREEEVKIRVLEDNLKDLYAQIDAEEQKVKNNEVAIRSEKNTLAHNEALLTSLRSTHGSLEKRVRELESELEREKRKTAAQKEEHETFVKNTRLTLEKQEAIKQNIKALSGILQLEQRVVFLRETCAKRTQYLQDLQTEIARITEERASPDKAASDLNKFIVQLAETKLRSETAKKQVYQEEKELVELEKGKAELLKRKENEKRAREAAPAKPREMRTVQKMVDFQLPLLPPLVPKRINILTSSNGTSMPMPKMKSPVKPFKLNLPKLSFSSRGHPQAKGGTEEGCGAATATAAVSPRLPPVQEEVSVLATRTERAPEVQQAITEKPRSTETGRTDASRLIQQQGSMESTTLGKRPHTVPAEPDGLTPSKKPSTLNEVQRDTLPNRINADRRNDDTTDSGNAETEVASSTSGVQQHSDAEEVDQGEAYGTQSTTHSISQTEYLEMLKTTWESPAMVFTKRPMFQGTQQPRSQESVVSNPFLVGKEQLCSSSATNVGGSDRNEVIADIGGSPTSRTSASEGGRSGILARLEVACPQSPEGQCFSLFDVANERQGDTGSSGFAFVLGGSKGSGPSGLF